MSVHYCICHPKVLATAHLTVPCAPEGRIYVCRDCAAPDRRSQVFAAYQAEHAKRIEVFKTPGNPEN